MRSEPGGCIVDRVLTAPPHLTTLYGTALARSLQSRLRRGGAGSGLPKERHRLDKLTPDPEEVRRFQLLMGRSSSGFLPSGYVHTLVFPVAVSVLARRDFPLPLLGMIHLRNEIDHLRPIRQDEQLSATAWVENLLPHRSGTQVDVVVEVRSAAEPVWNGRSTYLAKGVHMSGPAAGSPGHPAGERDTEDLPGHPTAVWSLSGDAGRRYAAVSGDYNPIHLNAVSARAAGLNRPIAHGMYLASRMVSEVGPGEATPFRWTVDFRAPVTLPSKVFLSAEVDRDLRSQWLGAEVIAWDPRRRRAHFSGRLGPL